MSCLNCCGLVMIGVTLLIAFLLCIGFFKIPSVYAGWSSALIEVCDPEGNCYIEDCYVWVNGWEHCV